MALLVELVANRPDAPVHHVAGGDHVGAGFGLRDRGLGEQLDGDVVVDLAVAHEAAVAVRGVLAQADVGDHGQLGVGLLERPYRKLDDALLVVGAGAGLVLGGGYAEQQHGPDSGREDLLAFGDQLGDRQPLHAWHRGNLLAHAFAGNHEQRLDQVRRRYVGLADQVAERLRAAQPPHPRGGKAHRANSRSPQIFAMRDAPAARSRRRARQGAAAPRRARGRSRRAPP